MRNPGRNRKMLSGIAAVLALMLVPPAAVAQYRCDCAVSKRKVSACRAQSQERDGAIYMTSSSNRCSMVTYRVDGNGGPPFTVIDGASELGNVRDFTRPDGSMRSIVVESCDICEDKLVGGDQAKNSTTNGGLAESLATNLGLEDDVDGSDVANLADRLRQSSGTKLSSDELAARLQAWNAQEDERRQRDVMLRARAQAQQDQSREAARRREAIARQAETERQRQEMTGCARTGGCAPDTFEQLLGLAAAAEDLRQSRREASSANRHETPGVAVAVGPTAPSRYGRSTIPCTLESGGKGYMFTDQPNAACLPEELRGGN